MELKLTAFQQNVLSINSAINLALLGGRGGGKSTAMAALALRSSELLRDRARMLFIRRSYPGLRDFEQTTRDVFGQAYGDSARYSINDHVWKLPTGASFELSQLDGANDLTKQQGRSITTLFADEIGQYPSSQLLEMLRSNLRAPNGVPIRTVFAANPGSVGQSWIAKRWILGKEPWKAYQDEFGAWWMWCPSTLEDNEHIDRAAYRSQLTAACKHDPELLRAWLEGSFMSRTGAFFGLVLDEARNALGPIKEHKVPCTQWGEKWKVWLSHDHGTSRPSVTLLLAESPGDTYLDRYYPRGSIIALDEYATYQPGDLNQGLGLTAAVIAERIIENLCKKWGVQASGVGDDAMFAKTGHAMSIADEYAKAGVSFTEARKGRRIAGWQRMSRMLADAGASDKPALYIARNCIYTWETLPFLSRDKLDTEDLDSSGPDHAADALRYGLLRVQPAMSIKIGWAT